MITIAKAAINVMMKIQGKRASSAKRQEAKGSKKFKHVTHIHNDLTVNVMRFILRVKRNSSLSCRCGDIQQSPLVCSFMINDSIAVDYGCSVLH